MALLSYLLDKIRSLLPYIYSTTTTAEIRMSGQYGGDVILSSIVSWADFYGSPYYVTIATGGETVSRSGWIDVAGNGKIRIQSLITGRAGSTGNAVIKFEVSPVPNSAFAEVDTSLNITIASNGATEVVDFSEITVSAWRFIRVYSVTHSTGHDLDVSVRVLGAVQPVRL